MREGGPTQLGSDLQRTRRRTVLATGQRPPPGVATAVTTAVTNASAERFDSVLGYTGTGHALPTAHGAKGRPAVIVAGRGDGLAPAEAGYILGLGHWVPARRSEIAGAASLDSARGAGARLESRWPG